MPSVYLCNLEIGKGEEKNPTKETIAQERRKKRQENEKTEETKGKEGALNLNKKKEKQTLLVDHKNFNGKKDWRWDQFPLVRSFCSFREINTEHTSMRNQIIWPFE